MVRRVIGSRTTINYLFTVRTIGLYLLGTGLDFGLAAARQILMDADSHFTETTLRVRYAETDQMGMVYYANFFVWFEIARTDYCRQHGFAYRQMEEDDGLFITVAEAQCRYRAPARYDDELLVRTRLTACRKRVLVFAYEVYRPATDELLATGETVHVITDRQGRPCTLPEKYREYFLSELHPGH